MSTILKALRRLEEEKASRVERPLGAAVVQSAPPPRRSGWLRGAAIVVGAAALGAGAVLWLQPDAPETPPAAPVAPVASAPPVSAAASAPPAPAGLSQPTAHGVAGPRVGAPVAVASPDAMPPALMATELEEQAALAPVPEPPAPAPRVAPAAPRPGPAARVAPAPVAAAPPTLAPPPPVLPATGEPVRLARREPAPAVPAARAPATNAPPRSAETGVVVGASPSSGRSDPVESVRPAEAPKRTAARAPATVPVTVVRTVWHPRPERRTALLETPDAATPQTFREGEQVGALTLLRIEPSGVVFERDGEEIRRDVGAR